MVKAPILLALLIVASMADFAPTSITVTIPAGANELEYSPDHRFLGVSAPNEILIVQSQTGKTFQSISNLNYTVTSFAFNHDATWLALASNAGEVHLYNTTQGKFTPSEYIYINQGSTPVVTSVCFTSDDKYVVIGLDQDKVVAWDFVAGTNLSSAFGGFEVRTVSCSPTDPKLFVAGGGLNTQSYLAFFNILDQDKLENIKNITKPENQISSTCFNSNGTNVYQVQTNGKIYKYSSDGTGEVSVDVPQIVGNALQKIRVSGNERVIATVNATKVIILTLVPTTGLAAYTLTFFDTTIDSVALSSVGEKAFYVDATGKAAGLASCPLGKYSDQAGTCLDCNTECPICDIAPDQCYSCTPRYYLQDTRCLKCITGCLTCTNGNTCDQCDTHFHDFNNTCVCDSGYFYRNEQCLACEVGCTTCTDETTCTACQPEFDLKNASCFCKAGTYLSGKTCLACIRGCLDCDNGATCKTCDVKEHYINDINQICVCDPADHARDDGTNCVCIDGYYEDNVQECARCTIGCLKCQDGNSCQQCDVNFHPFNNTCVCNNGYFLKNLTCVPCEVGCDFCTDEVTCTGCKAEFDLRNASCFCKAGTYLVVDTCAACIRGCLDCDNGATCKTCEPKKYTKDDGNVCVCDPAKFVRDDGTNCVCIDGYYDNSDVCLKCPLGCKTCTSSQVCQTCEGSLVTTGGVCKCPDSGEWVDADFTCKACNATLFYCLECDNPDACKICNETLDRAVKNGKCLCKSGYFNNTDDLCLPCNILGCEQCTSTDVCTICNADNFWQLDPATNKCRCRKHYFQNGQECSACSIGCNTCLTASECTECDNGQHWVADQAGACVCQLSYYRNGDQCDKCIVGCASCDNGAECLVCDGGAHWRKNQTGICVCVDNRYFRRGDECVSCAAIAHCVTCSNGTRCQSCSEPFTAKDGLCKCQDGKYVKDSTVCEQCPQGCTLCNSADECTQCKDGYELEDLKCKKSGIDTLVIVLIVVGVVVLAGAVFVVIKCIKKRKSPLSQDDYEEL